MRRCIAAAVLLAFASAQHGMMNHHPAAGPEMIQNDFARTLMDNEFLVGPSGQPDVSVDIESRRFIEPLKEFSKIREEQLRREADEIAQVLSSRKEKSQTVSWSTWLGSLLGCAAVVSCGILPALFLPVNAGEFLQSEDGRRKLNLLLSFAVGSLLGDVFLHLLPETWASYGVDMEYVGMWIVCGLLVCFLAEKLCATTEESQHKVCAIMNLVANIIDNFTHGLAVGGSFLVSTKFGILTTAAILLHEIPHEVSDFAILLRADFGRWVAIKAQLVTATAGVVGSCAALWLHTGEDMNGNACWILPFTAGGFINIALAQILPELMEEEDRKQNLYQLLLIIGGVGVMAFINQFHV